MSGLTMDKADTETMLAVTIKTKITLHQRYMPEMSICQCSVCQLERGDCLTPEVVDPVGTFTLIDSWGHCPNQENNDVEC